VIHGKGIDVLAFEMEKGVFFFFKSDVWERVVAKKHNSGSQKFPMNTVVNVKANDRLANVTSQEL
jgi:hypothetical protein